MTSLDIIKDYLKEIRSERKRLLPRVMGQYAELRSFGGLYNFSRMNAIEPNYDQNITFSKRGRRALRKAIGIERKEARYFNRLLEFLEKILPYIPEPYFNQLGRIKTELVTSHAETVRVLSVGGLFDKQVRNNKDIRDIASTLIPEVKRFVEKTSIPFMAALKELDAFCHKEAKIIEAKRQLVTLNVNLDAAFSRYSVSPQVILVDTSFLFNVLEARREQKRELVDLHLPDNVIKIYPMEILRENKYGEVSVFRRILGREKFKGVNFTMKATEIDEVVKFWKNTDKFNRSSNREKTKFLNSADVKLLGMALRNVKESPTAKVVILTQDADIYDSVRKAKFYFNSTHPHWLRINCLWYLDNEVKKAA